MPYSRIPCSMKIVSKMIPCFEFYYPIPFIQSGRARAGGRQREIMKKTIFRSGILIPEIETVLLMVLFFLISITPGVSAAETISGTETILFTQTGEPSYLALDGNRILWLQQSKSPDTQKQGLYVYNLTEGTIRQLVRIGEPSEQSSEGNNATVHEILTPAVSGDLVVFAETGIMLTNITSGSTVRLTNRDDGSLPVSQLRHNQNPWIDGDRVVWTEHDGVSYSTVSGGRIVLLNLTTGKKEYVQAGMPGNQSFPRISGDYIVWNDYRNSKDSPDLYLMDIRNGTETRLVSSVRGVSFIEGDSVFWEERNSLGIDTIVRYTISTSTRSEIGSGWMGQTQAIPPVSDDRIVWRVSRSPSNVREEQGTIMVMDLRTGEKSQITSFEKGISFPVISGDRIVYTRGAGDDWSREPRMVVLYTITSPRPTAISTHFGIEDTSTRQSLSQYSVASSGTTPTASAGLPGIVPITSVLAGVFLLLKIRRDKGDGT